jgi:hypothetical protein
MLANRKILQLIVNDPASTEIERTEAKRALGELTTDQSPPAPRRGCNASVPQTQEDIDNDIESSFRHDSQLTTQDRIEVERAFEPSTQAILAAFGSSLLWLFQNNAEELRILIELHGETQSDFVRAKTIKTIQWIADYSTVAAAKLQAHAFIREFDNHQEHA